MIRLKRAAPTPGFTGNFHDNAASACGREMYWAFDALLRRCKNIRLVPGANDFAHAPGMLLRSLKTLHIAFDAA